MKKFIHFIYSFIALSLFLINPTIPKKESPQKMETPSKSKPDALMKAL